MSHEQLVSCSLSVKVYLDVAIVTKSREVMTTGIGVGTVGARGINNNK